MGSIMAAIPSLLLTLPLLLLVLAAWVYALLKRDELGRPATLVVIGGALVLLEMLIGIVVNMLLFSGALEMGDTLQGVMIARGLAGFVLSTLGWGLILLAVFVGRESATEELV